MKNPEVIYVMWDAAGRAIYVGQTQDLRHRMYGHRKADWFPEVASITTSVEMDRRDALRVEGLLVALMKPRHNRTVDGQGGRPEQPVAPPCGTPPALRRHYRHHEPIDELCRTMWNNYCNQKAAERRQGGGS